MNPAINYLYSLKIILLSCGIAAAILYGTSDLLLGLTKPEYNFASQSASVLNAYGTPTRTLMLTANLIAGIFLLAFSFGIWIISEQNWILKLLAIFIAINAIFSMIASTFFPIHLDQPMNSSVNKINVILMFLSVLFYLLAIITGIFANHNWFRYLSMGIILLYTVLFILGNAIGKSHLEFFGEHGPWVGVQERTMIYTWLLWLIFQAVVLI